MTSCLRRKTFHNFQIKYPVTIAISFDSFAYCFKCFSLLSTARSKLANFLFFQSNDNVHFWNIPLITWSCHHQHSTTKQCQKKQIILVYYNLLNFFIAHMLHMLQSEKKAPCGNESKMYIFLAHPFGTAAVVRLRVCVFSSTKELYCGWKKVYASKKIFFTFRNASCKHWEGNAFMHIVVFHFLFHIKFRSFLHPKKKKKNQRTKPQEWFVCRVLRGEKNKHDSSYM